MTDAVAIEIVRRTVSVDCATEEAFRIFTTDAMSWWPVGSHSLHADVTDIVFEQEVGGEVYEVSASGEKGHWATILEYEPPSRIVLSWEVSPRSEATTVEVRFLPADTGTVVELEHRGWERVTDAASEKRDDYDAGWGFVLGRFVDRAG